MRKEKRFCNIFVKLKMDAETLKQYTYDNPPTETLERDPNVLTEYHKYQKTDKSQLFIKNIKRELETKPYVFIPNRFPYKVKSPIEHSCLWYSGKFDHDDVIEFLDNEGIDYITFFENNDTLKSVKEISHYHIFHY